MLSLKDRPWKEFFLANKDGLFELRSSNSAIDKNKLLSTGNKDIPYVTRTDLNNGFNLFVSKKQKEKYKIDPPNVITIGLDTQTAFYQPYQFYTGQNIQVLKSNHINKYNALFIIKLLKIQLKKFNWGGNGATLGRLSRIKIMLPINKRGDPDWTFMENYIKQIEEKQKEEYRKFALEKLKYLEYKEIPKLEEKEWKAFLLESLFYISGSKTTSLDKLHKYGSGNYPYVTTQTTNNGVANYFNHFTEKGNILTVDSAATGFCSYQEYNFSASDHVEKLIPRFNLTKELAQFFTLIINRNNSKFSYGYKANQTRLKRQHIMLPINSKGEPDYDYMEQYVKNIMYKQLNAYLK